MINFFVNGIAAALKILFSEKLGGESEVSLKRNELIVRIENTIFNDLGFDEHL